MRDFNKDIYADLTQVQSRSNIRVLFQQLANIGYCSIPQVRRRQGVRQPKVVSGIGLWNAPGNAPVRVFSGWSIYTSPQTLISSPSDSARRVTSIPRVPDSNSHPTPTILRAFQGAFPGAFGRAGPAGRTHISRIHSNGQPSVAIIPYCNTIL